MKILVTGALGFVGRHLTRELQAHGHTVLGADQAVPPGVPDVVALDLRNAAAVTQLIQTHRPDGCVHLAGIAFVPMGWSDPELVFDVNLGGTLHLLEACRLHSPQTRLLVVSSVEIYGRKAHSGLVTEDTPMKPENLYAVSKLGADLGSLLYAEHHGMPVMTARPQNHIGPGQSPKFVTSAFAQQLVAIRNGVSEPLIKVGNLDSEREFTDVRDVARAYRLLVERGLPGQAYNIASGHFVKIGRILEDMCELVGVQPRIEVDPALYRPTDTFARLDTTRIRQHVGWRPEIPLQQTLRDILHDVEQNAVSHAG